MGLQKTKHPLNPNSLLAALLLGSVITGSSLEINVKGGFTL